MYSGLLELYIWPQFKIDPRVVCTFPYLGKHFVSPGQRRDLEFDIKNYCVLYFEFPKYRKPVVFSLKTPHSYSEFLKLKNPEFRERVNSNYEIRVLYYNSLDHLDVILDSLK